MKKIDKNSKNLVKLAAINPYLEDNIVKPTEKFIQGQKFVGWGDSNQYPTYLYNLYNDVSILHSIVNGIVEYVGGDGVNVISPYLTEFEAFKLINEITFQYVMYGGIAINVLRNKAKQVVKLIPLDWEYIRMPQDKDSKIVYYSEDFGQKSSGRCKAIEYPLFDPEKKDESSIFIFNPSRKTVYPVPTYAASILAIETEKKITEFHYNSIVNGFSSNVIISFCNGIPDDEQQEEISNNIDEKFTGSENAGRPIINFCNDTEHSVQVDRIDTDSFADRYEALSKRTQQDIFTAFRAFPVLFGIYQEGTGFNDQDYQEAYKLFNRTTIKPIQNLVKQLIEHLLEQTTIEIKPFTINFD